MERKQLVCDKPIKLTKYILQCAQDISYSALMKALRNKDIKVNGVRTNNDIALSVGDKIEVFYTKTLVECYNEIYSDNNVLIVNKKSGFTSEEVYNNVQNKFSESYFIHRLDRNTQGIMIFALNAKAEAELLKGFKSRTFEKYYTATVIGKMAKQAEVLTAYLVKDSKNSLVKIYNSPVKNSVAIKTGYEVLSVKKLENGEYVSILNVKLYTGKTHQIRAHLAHIGHAIVGDGKYGDNAFNKKYGAKSQMLTASSLVFHFEKNSPLYYLDNKIFTVN